MLLKVLLRKKQSYLYKGLSISLLFKYCKILMINTILFFCTLKFDNIIKLIKTYSFTLVYVLKY